MLRSCLIAVAVAAAATFSLPENADAAVRVYRGPNRARVVVRGPNNTFRYSAPRAYYGPRVYRNYGYVTPYNSYYGGYGSPYARGGVYYNGPRANVWIR